MQIKLIAGQSLTVEYMVGPSVTSGSAMGTRPLFSAALELELDLELKLELENNAHFSVICHLTLSAVATQLQLASTPHLADLGVSRQAERILVDRCGARAAVTTGNLLFK